MKVLITTMHYLDGNSGGAYASCAFINAIAAVADSTYLMYPSKQGEKLTKINPCVTKFPVRYEKSKALKLLDLITGRVHRFFKAFEPKLKEIKPDIVVFDNSRVSYKLIDIAKKNGCKVITIHHNYEYEYNRDDSPWYLKNILLYWTARYESDAVKKSDINLTLTLQDKEALANKYNNGDASSFEVLGIFEYTNSTTKITEPTNNKALTFIITGDLSAMQTENSLIPWIDTFYPVLKKIFPNSLLIIAGKKPSINLEKKCQAMGIELIPSPQSMQEILDRADIYICPVSLGGGIKLRIMDGLKNGLPVLTHAVSARGYEIFEKNKMLFVYSDIQSFEQCLKEHLCHKSSKQSTIQFYENNCSFNTGINKFSKILNQLF